MTVTSDARFDFKFVDGMRGLAALAVAFLHASLFTGYEGDVARDYPLMAKIFFLGNYAVAIFIVLSGFVLMLPIAKAPGLKIRRGTWTYLKRRAMRILPPYLISLLIFGVLILCVPLLQTPSGTAWDSKIPVTIDGVIAHLFVVHNLNADWAYQINGPAWSIGTEWQLYFALPFMILPIWRKFGGTVALAVSLVLSIASAVLVPSWSSGHLWFLALFTMGAFVAHAVVQGWKPKYLGWSVILAGVMAGVLVIVLSTPLWLNEIAVGCAIALAIFWLAIRTRSGNRSLLHKVLESRQLVSLGLWSFSLYLIHSPLLGLANLLLLEVDMSTSTRLFFQIIVALPVAALISYAFHIVVERRFITSHQQRIGAKTPAKQHDQEVSAHSAS